MNLPAVLPTTPQRDLASRDAIQRFLGGANAAFDLDQARAHQRALIDEIKQEFDWERPEQFASAQAAGVSRFADVIVQGVRSSELGGVHDHLTELRMVTKRLEGRLEPRGLFGRLFFNSRRALERFASDWDSIDGQIGQVIATLERDKRGSMVTIERLRELGDEVILNFRRMAAAIIAGRELLDDERERLAGLRTRLDEAGDAVDATALRTLEHRADVLDRRLTNLEKSRAIAAGMIPTIQQTLQSEIIVSEELDMALTQAIPVMKQQLALVVEQVRQQERLQSLAATRGTTEKMMEEVAERLRTNQEAVDAQVRDGIASADKVAEFLNRIGATIEEIDQRQAAALKDRAAARSQLQSAVNDLRDRLLQGSPSTSANLSPPA